MAATTQDLGAARAIAAAMTAAKRSPGAPVREQRSGRLDRTRLARVATGDRRVFMQPQAPAPKRLRVVVMLDASGSMRGHEAQTAMQMGRNLAEAFTMLPNVTASVWAHTTHAEGYSYRSDGSVEAGEMDEVIDVYPLWRTGQPTKGIDGYSHIQLSGNIDGFAIAYAGDELRRDLRPGEQGLIIMVSDGAPAYSSSNGWLHMRLVREDLRRSGIPVISVSVAHALSFRTQCILYGGPENVVQYDPNTRVTAKALAKAIGHNLG